MSPKAIMAGLVALGMLGAVFAGLVVYRLGPQGYSASDAAKEREALCAWFEHHGLVKDRTDCPRLKGL